MELSFLHENGNSFQIWGECPHCSPVQSAFGTVTNTFEAKSGTASLLVAVARCVARRGLILAAITNQGMGWHYSFHYPLGKTRDAVSEDIPENIRMDLREAKRCQWVEAYNATVEMCRRAIENCCLHKGVPDNVRTLAEMINWLAVNDIITPGLRDTADKVRLGGDRGAHPPQGIPPEEQQNEEAKADHENREGPRRCCIGVH